MSLNDCSLFREEHVSAQRFDLSVALSDVSERGLFDSRHVALREIRIVLELEATAARQLLERLFEDREQELGISSPSLVHAS